MRFFQQPRSTHQTVVGEVVEQRWTEQIEAEKAGVFTSGSRRGGERSHNKRLAGGGSAATTLGVLLLVVVSVLLLVVVGVLLFFCLVGLVVGCLTKQDH